MLTGIKLYLSAIETKYYKTYLPYFFILLLYSKCRHSQSYNLNLQCSSPHTAVASYVVGQGCLASHI